MLQKELFTGRRPAGQSILQMTLRHWKSLACIDMKRETTGCLLIPSMGKEELSNDRDKLVELVKAALPEVRAEWHVDSLETKLRTAKIEDKREQYWLEKFPCGWIILFGGVLSLSSASLETNLYTRETIEFDINIYKMLDKFNENYIQKLDISAANETYISSSFLGLSVELEFNLSKNLMIFRVSYNVSNGRASKELELIIEADHLSSSDPEPLQYSKLDRLVLSLPEQDNMINIIIKDDDISDEIAKTFDRTAGVSVRLDRFLGRR